MPFILKILQASIQLFYTKNFNDDKFVKLYDITMQHCKPDDTTMLMRNPLIGIIMSHLRANNITVGKCPTPKGETDILNNIVLPLKSFPAFNIRRKIKVAMRNTGKIPSSKRMINIYNCTFFGTIW